MNEIVKLASKYSDLVDNPTARVPVCLCLDTSGSMCGTPIAELIGGIELFRENVLNDDIAKYSAEVCIVTFDSNVECVVDFTAVDGMPQNLQLDADGGTSMGDGVNMALDLLEKRKEEYKRNGVDYYQPWLILMTDGGDNGDRDSFTRACDRVADMVKNRKLSVFPIGIGEGADMKVLEEITTKKPLRLKGLKFRELFSWLSKSISVVSNSMPGEKIKLDTSGFDDWASL